MCIRDSFSISLGLPLLGMGCLILLGCFDDALEVLWSFSPGEWRGVLAVFLQVTKQKILEVFLGTLHALRQCLPGENAEKAFNHIHPRGVRSGVVKVHSWMTQEPLFGRFVLVDVEVVQNNVKIADRIGLYDIVH